MIRSKKGKQKDPSYQWINLWQCKDFEILHRKLSSMTLDYLEAQIEEYLGKDEITEEYLTKIPLVVCWYEGMIDTEIFLMEMEGEIH